MGAHYFNNGDSKGIVHLADIYSYGGYIFEFNKYYGVTPLRKDNWEAYKRNLTENHPFWDVFEKWEKLTEQEKEESRIYG
jgi:hypothetical protein